MVDRGGDQHTVTAPTGTITSEETRTDRRTLQTIHANCQPSSPPVMVELAVIVTGVRHVLKTGWCRSLAGTVFLGILWEGGMDLPIDSIIATQVRNDTGAEVKVDTGWTWKT